MVRAAVTGAIDYSRADPRDRQWRKKLRWTLQEVERQNAVDDQGARQRHLLALVSHGRLEDDSFREVRDKALETLTELHGLYYPWHAKVDTKSVAQDLKALWVSHFGNPDSPETQAMLAAGIAAMRAQKSTPRDE